MTAVPGLVLGGLAALGTLVVVFALLALVPLGNPLPTLVLGLAGYLLAGGVGGFVGARRTGSRALALAGPVLVVAVVTALVFTRDSGLLVTVAQLAVLAAGAWLGAGRAVRQ